MQTIPEFDEFQQQELEEMLKNPDNRWMLDMADGMNVATVPEQQSFQQGLLGDTQQQNVQMQNFDSSPAEQLAEIRAKNQSGAENMIQQANANIQQAMQGQQELQQRRDSEMAATEQQALQAHQQKQQQGNGLGTLLKIAGMIYGGGAGGAAGAGSAAAGDFAFNYTPMRWF